MANPKTMIKTTKPQRQTLKKLWRRFCCTPEQEGIGPLGMQFILAPYKEFRKTVRPGPGCIMVPIWYKNDFGSILNGPNIWYGIEPDGHDHT